MQALSLFYHHSDDTVYLWVVGFSSAEFQAVLPWKHTWLSLSGKVPLPLRHALPRVCKTPFAPYHDSPPCFRKSITAPCLRCVPNAIHQILTRQTRDTAIWNLRLHGISLALPDVNRTPTSANIGHSQQLLTPSYICRPLSLLLYLKNGMLGIEELVTTAALDEVSGLFVILTSLARYWAVRRFSSRHSWGDFVYWKT